MSLKEKIENNTNFSFYNEICFGKEIIIENKEILSVNMIKIISYNEYIPSATIEPLAFLFKECLKKDNKKKYEYYLIFLEEDYEKYTSEIIEAYNKKFEEKFCL